MKNNIYHLNDKTHKYLSYAQSKRQHEYLGLPGKFKARCSQEIVFKNMEIGRRDEFYVTDEGLFINLEEETGTITPETLKKFAKYVIFACYEKYPNNVYLGVICHKKPKNNNECYQYSESCYIKIHYHYFEEEELYAKYENLINKVKQKKTLTDMEAMDIAFICKFISNKNALKVIETLSHIFKQAEIPDKILKMDIKAILGAMIIKRIKTKTKIKKLLEVIGMDEIQDEITQFVYEEYGEVLRKKDEKIESMTEELASMDKELASMDRELASMDRELDFKDKELDSKDRELDSKNNEINSFRSKADQLKKIDDLKSDEAQKIIRSLLLL